MLLVPAEEFIRWQLDAPPRLPELLGALDFVCAECARNVPAQNGA